MLAWFLAAPIYANVNFSGLDLSADSRLLFRAVFSGGGAPDQSSLFLTQLPAAGISARAGPPQIKLRPLSAFPEYIDLIENNKTLQIRNAFGMVRVPVTGGLPQPLNGIPYFTGSSGLRGRTDSAAVSADGRWVLYLEPVSAAYSKLILLDTNSGRKTEISSKVEKPEHTFPASWSADSRFFIYCRENRLFFYSVNNISTNISSYISIDEKFRLLGEGSINSIYWGRGGDFFYLLGSTLYQVRGADLFLRALYADFMEAGKPAGNIPFEFNPYSDKFWVSPDAQSLLLSRDGKNISYHPLSNGNFVEKRGAVQPYLTITQPVLDIQVLWPSDGTLTVIAFASSEKGAVKKSCELLAWRLNTRASAGAFINLAGAGQMPYSGASISPDGNRVLFWGETGIVVYDYAGWNQAAVLSAKRGYACLWISNDEIISGDAERIEKIRIGAGSNSIISRGLICLSQADFSGFENRNVSSPLIMAQAGGRLYSTDGAAPWAEITGISIRNASLASALYRVYLEKQSGGPFENLPMVRNMSSVGTFSLFPGANPPTGQKALGLCFDLYDDNAGLSEALDALDCFCFKATFFLGGEFIRRYPELAGNIAKRGHETASLFFAPIDLSDARYRVSPDFISQGLARNEDEFFKASGGELALFWHPPFYSTSPEIRAAAAAAGYLTVKRDFDPMDWVSRNDEIRLGLPVYSAAEIIDRIMAGAKGGSVIPLRLGFIQGGRREYLFSRINVLFDALVREGYRVVPLSQL
ncbi:MAG: polysaccharide deacetylase family protein [Treponema sp.]|nr:polysaccharide deacetylase family protein [Treponema sp.]